MTDKHADIRARLDALITAMSSDAIATDSALCAMLECGLVKVTWQELRALLYEVNGMNDAEKLILELRREHAVTWRDMNEHYWLARLMQEVGELASALVGDHKDTPEWELRQISAICINWLDMRMVSNSEATND